MLKSAYPLVARGSAEACHNSSSWLQKGSRCPVIHTGEDEDIVGNKDLLTPEQVALYKTPEGIVELNKLGIKIAIERRVALFFQQCLLVHGMSQFTFSCKGADDQIGTSPAMRLSTPTGASVTLKREAAHCSTTPTLIAHAKNGSTPNGFVFLKGGSSHHQHNATIGMHMDVNGADELIDGKNHAEALRPIAVGLFNRVAEGLDPAKATEEFIQAFYKRVKAVKKDLAVTDTRKFVLKAYKKKISKIQLAATEKVFYDRLLGVVINPNDPNEAVLREEVYKKRYDIIRFEEVIQNRIAKRISDVKQQMPNRESSSIEFILLKEFEKDKELKSLEKLLGKTAAIFEANYLKRDDGSDRLSIKDRRAHKSFNTRITKLQTKHKNLITPLKDLMKKDFEELIAAEHTYKSGLFCALRWTVNGWTQVRFTERYTEMTGYSVSPSWVSRVEGISKSKEKDPDSYKTPLNQRARLLSIREAELCAQTFGVHPGIFHPRVFTSAPT